MLVEKLQAPFIHLIVRVLALTADETPDELLRRRDPLCVIEVPVRVLGCRVEVRAEIRTPGEVSEVLRIGRPGNHAHRCRRRVVPANHVADLPRVRIQKLEAWNPLRISPYLRI